MLITKILVGVYQIISFLYWYLVEKIVILLTEDDQDSLHALKIGSRIYSEGKKRSFYRQEMLLTAFLLCLNLRDKSCLDLGCHDGFWSFKLGELGIVKLKGIDFGNANIQRANFLKSVYNFTDFQFQQGDIFKFLYEEEREKYDLVFLLSILYQLPEDADWSQFFQAVSQINKEALIIDTRWFDTDDFWYDETFESRSTIKTDRGIVKKWLPTRSIVFSLLQNSGYESILEVNPSGFLENPEEAAGAGIPYCLEAVSDYITNNRTLVFAYKEKSMQPDIEKLVSQNYIKQII